MLDSELIETVDCPYCDTAQPMPRFLEKMDCGACGWFFRVGRDAKGEPVAWRSWDNDPRGECDEP